MIAITALMRGRRRDTAAASLIPLIRPQTEPPVEPDVHIRYAPCSYWLLGVTTTMPQVMFNLDTHETHAAATPLRARPELFTEITTTIAMAAAGRRTGIG